MKRSLSILIVLLMAVTMAFGQITVVTPPLQDGVYVLRVANGQATLTTAVQPNVGPVVTPVIPGPGPGPVVPTTDLKTAATAALAAVVDADKDTRVKQLAFAINMATASFKGTGKPNPEAIDVVNSFLLSATGDGKAAWTPFFAAIDAPLKASATYDMLKANYGVIVSVLEASMPDSATDGGEMLGSFPTYGLQQDGADGKWLAFIMELMKNLPALIEMITKLMVLF